MTNSKLLLKLAHDLIGTRGIYQGKQYALIEVLDDGPQLVLEPIESDAIVQSTFQGEAKRFVQNNYTLPLYSEVKKDLHPVVAEFLGADICAVLREQIDAQ